MKRGTPVADMALLLSSIILRKGKKMPAVTKKELLLLGQTHKNYDVCLIKTMIDGDRWWRMVVVLSPDQAFEVQTAHAKTKVWRRLDIAIDFVAETCPGLKELRVVLEDLEM